MQSVGAPTYKRDQVERAIAVVSRRLSNNEPTAEKLLKVDVKRLLDFDRAEVPTKIPGRYAFFGQPTGQGHDTAYTVHDAFALLVGERLLHGGLPQSRVVRFMRFLRSELDPELDRILNVSPSILCPDASEYVRSGLIRNGNLVQVGGQMTFLVAPSAPSLELSLRLLPLNEFGSPFFCRGTEELSRGLAHFGRSKLVVIALELANIAFQLEHWLHRIPVRKRGRS